MPHWRTMMDQNYLGAWDFPQDRVGIIERVEGVKLPGAGEIKENRKPVLSIRGATKKLIVNATIGKTIAGMYGPNTDDWVGKRITMYATTTKAKGRGTVDCVRVRPVIPTGPGEAISSMPVNEDMRARQIAGVEGTESAREPGSDDE